MSVKSVASCIATFSKVICRLEMMALRASGRSGLANMASKIVASVSIASPSGAAAGMPRAEELIDGRAAAVCGAASNRPGIRFSRLGAPLIGAAAVTGRCWSSSLRRKIRRSSAPWLSRAAAAPPAALFAAMPACGVVRPGAPAKPAPPPMPIPRPLPAGMAGRRASSACCRASRLPLLPASAVDAEFWLFLGASGLVMMPA